MHFEWIGFRQIRTQFKNCLRLRNFRKIINVIQKDTHTLTFTGNDRTGDYNDWINWYYSPRRAHADSIETIIVKDGVTYLGNYIFDYMHKATQINIPQSVTSFGNNVFQNCYSLKTVTIPSTITIHAALGEFGMENPPKWSFFIQSIPKNKRMD